MGPEVSASACVRRLGVKRPLLIAACRRCIGSMNRLVAAWLWTTVLKDLLPCAGGALAEAIVSVAPEGPELAIYSTYAVYIIAGDTSPCILGMA